MNKVIFSLVVILTLFVLVSNKGMMQKTKAPSFIRKTKEVKIDCPPSLEMYYAIEQYSDSFNIPKEYAYKIAYKETHYQGPFHWSYNHEQNSTAGAVGPMQVMVGTARGINKDGVSRHKLMTDIEYNVMTSMKLMRHLYDLRKSWALALGEYNTGQICVNGYARDVLSNDINWKYYE